MPSTNLAAYLAKNYLTANNGSDSAANSDFADSSRPKKKRKKNREPDGIALIIADDDDELSLRGGRAVKGEDDDDVPLYEGSAQSAEFRKKKSSTWTVVDGGASTARTAQLRQTERTTTGTADDADDADRILAEAVAESDARRAAMEDDDAPAVVDDSDIPRLSSGVKAGLQTAADTARLLEEEERTKARESKLAKKNKDTQVPEEETIYRDATGRRIDVSMKRAEARAKEEEKRRQEKKAKEDAMGEVQRREKEERKQELEDAKFLSLARGADDEEMNARLKEVVRWDDPMAQYMAQKKAEEETTSGRSKGGAGDGDGGARVAKKKMYQGHAPPNRYGIAPGWRWDGVDRGNGFEKEWFQARGRKAMNEDLSYQWQLDE